MGKVKVSSLGGVSPADNDLFYVSKNNYGSYTSNSIAYSTIVSDIASRIPAGSPGWDAAGAWASGAGWANIVTTLRTAGCPLTPFLAFTGSITTSPHVYAAALGVTNSTSDYYCLYLCRNNTSAFDGDSYQICQINSSGTSGNFEGTSDFISESIGDTPYEICSSNYDSGIKQRLFRYDDTSTMHNYHQVFGHILLISPGKSLVLRRHAGSYADHCVYLDGEAKLGYQAGWQSSYIRITKITPDLYNAFDVYF